MIIFERNYPVNIFNTDFTGRLSPGALFSFFEDLAGRHATVLGWGRHDMMDNGFFWALSRMVVKIETLPEAMDEVTIRTWPRGTETIYALRDLEMFDASGKRLAGASSSWVIVDYNTRRAQRPDRALAGLNVMFPEERALDTNAGKVPALPHGDHPVTRLNVRLDDIDVNRHVNNARYIYWATNCYEEEFITTNAPDTIEVNYLQESHHGDRINILTCEDKQQDKTFLHSILRESDNAELCRVRFSWKENGL